VITDGLNDQFVLIDPPAGFDKAKGLSDADAGALASSFPSIKPKAGQDTLRLFYVGKIEPAGTTPRDALLVSTIDGTVFAGGQLAGFDHSAAPHFAAKPLLGDFFVAPSSGRFPAAQNLAVEKPDKSFATKPGRPCRLWNVSGGTAAQTQLDTLAKSKFIRP